MVGRLLAFTRLCCRAVNNRMGQEHSQGSTSELLETNGATQNVTQQMMARLKRCCCFRTTDAHRAVGWLLAMALSRVTYISSFVDKGHIRMSAMMLADKTIEACLWFAKAGLDERWDLLGGPLGSVATERSAM